MKKRVTLVTISLDNMAGGLERNIVRVANYLAECGHTVSLLTFDRPGARTFYTIDPRVTWHKVGSGTPHEKTVFSERLKILKRMRAAFQGPGDLPHDIIAFHHGVLVRIFLASLFLKVRVLDSERNSLSLYDHVRLRKWNFNFLMLFLTNKITVQFARYRDTYPAPLRGRIVAIPNVVEPALQKAAPDKPGADGRYRLLAIGRLCDQKNYQSLIEAFASLAPRFTDWDLDIMGDGTYTERLESLITAKGLQGRVRLVPPVSEKISQRFAGAHLYAMSSRWEGFPNALAEAMAHGLPAVGYAGCAGVGDLITHGKTGLLAPGNGNTPALAEALATLMGDADLRRTMGEAARQSMAQYDPAHIFPLWDALVTEAL